MNDISVVGTAKYDGMHDAEGKIATAENDTAARDDDVQPVAAHRGPTA